MFALLLILSVSSKLLDVKPSEVKSFISSNKDKFLLIYFCDFSLEPCVFFTNTTNPYFKRLEGKVARIDVTTQEDAEHLREFELKDFPYLIYIRPGKNHLPYTGSLEPIEIFSALDRIQRGPQVYEDIESVNKDLAEKLYTDGLVLTYQQSNLNLISDELMPYFPIAISNFPLQDFDCSGPCVVVFPPLILQEKLKPSWSAIKGQATLEQIVPKYYKDLVWMTPNSHVWLGKEKPLMTLYAKISGKSDPSNTKYVINRYIAVAKEYFDIFTVAIAKIEDFQWILQDIGLGKHKSLLMFDDTEDMYYEADLVSSNYSVNTGKIKNFIENFIAGQAKPYIISEEIPENKVQNGITVLVGKTVKQELEKLKKDSILLVYNFYTEGLEGVIYFFEELASRMKELKFYKIEAHRNYVPPVFTDHGYPIAFYIKQGYEPQPIKINLEDPDETIKIIFKYYKSSHDL